MLHISKSRHPAQHIYMLHGQVLEAMDHAKYLGVDISKDLSWNTHINRISTNAMKRNINTKNTAIRTAAYQTLVRPQVEYASTVWSPFTQTYINKIERSKEGPCPGSTAAGVSNMLDSLGWRSLEDRRLILFYKIMYKLVAVPLPKYINHPVRMTRHMHSLHLVQIPATASYLKYSFFPLAIVQWNRLPRHVTVLPDRDSFRSVVRTVPHHMP